MASREPFGQRGRLLVAVVLLVALAGLFVWYGALAADQSLSEYPDEDHVGPDPDEYVGQHVVLRAGWAVMADVLTHVLVGFVIGTVLSIRYEWMGPEHVTLVMIGALSPDFVKISLVVPDYTVATSLGIPFSWSPLHTLGGSVIVVLLGALLLAPRVPETRGRPLRHRRGGPPRPRRPVAGRHGLQLPGVLAGDRLPAPERRSLPQQRSLACPGRQRRSRTRVARPAIPRLAARFGRRSVTKPRGTPARKAATAATPTGP